MKVDLVEKLGSNEVKPESLAKDVMKNSDLLPEVFDGVSSSNARVKFGCAKILRMVSESMPEMLYPQSGFFVEQLDSDNNIFKWIAIDVIANLTEVDADGVFEDAFKKYYGLLGDGSMVTAAHVVDNSGKIVRAKPHLTGRITAELLNIERTRRKPECKNILLGKAILAFSAYFDRIENKADVVSFVKRQLSSTRNATRVKAEWFLKAIERDE